MFCFILLVLFYLVHSYLTTKLNGYLLAVLRIKYKQVKEIYVASKVHFPTFKTELATLNRQCNC